jgi:hypothetical protein
MGLFFPESLHWMRQPARFSQSRGILRQTSRLDERAASFAAKSRDFLKNEPTA